MQVKCIKCGRIRNSNYMQEAVFRDAYWSARDEGVGVWKCNSTESCKKTRKENRLNGPVSQD